METSKLVFAQSVKTGGKVAKWHKATRAFWAQQENVFYTMCFLLVRDTWTMSDELPPLGSRTCMHCWGSGELEDMHNGKGT